MPTSQYEDVYEPPVMDATFAEKIDELKEVLAPPIPDFVSDAFSVSRAYAVGEYCIYENHFYKFTSAKSAGAWDSTKVQETTLAAEQSSTNSNLTNLGTDVKNMTNTSGTSTFTGKYVVIGKVCYFSLNMIKSGSSWTIANIPEGKPIVDGSIIAYDSVNSQPIYAGVGANNTTNIQLRNAGTYSNPTSVSGCFILE